MTFVIRSRPWPTCWRPRASAHGAACWSWPSAASPTTATGRRPCRPSPATPALTQAAVYAYFADKEALFEAAVDLDAAELIAGARAQLDDTLPLVELIPGLLLHLRLGVEQHRLARRVLAGQEPEVIHRVADLPALQDITAELTEQLRAEQAEGQVATDIDPEVLALGVETVVLSLLMSAVQVPVEADSRVPGIVAVFQSLFRPPPG